MLENFDGFILEVFQDLLLIASSTLFWFLALYHTLSMIHREVFQFNR